MPTSKLGDSIVCITQTTSNLINPTMLTCHTCVPDGGQNVCELGMAYYTLERIELQDWYRLETQRN